MKKRFICTVCDPDNPCELVVNYQDNKYEDDYPDGCAFAKGFDAKWVQDE